MSLSSWIPQDDESGCWVSEYQYEGPMDNGFVNHVALEAGAGRSFPVGSPQLEHEGFLIHATLEPGADNHFSGIRVLIGCRDTQDNPTVSALEVDDMVAGRTPAFEDQNLDIDQTTESILLTQKRGRELAAQWQDGDPRTGALPLYTLFFEIIDVSDTIWNRANLVLQPPQAIEIDWSRRTLYDYVELCTPASRSCVLFLSANLSFRGTPKQNNHCGRMYSSRTGILSHGVRILPPPSSRPPFVNLPSELLHMIFKDVATDKSQPGWRTTILSLGLVCRAWRPALDHLYEEFAKEFPLKPPNLLRLARTIELNPELGKKIRVFYSNHFLDHHEDFRSEGPYFDWRRAIVTILLTATRVKKLYLVDTHTALAQDLMRALCNCPDVKEFRFSYHSWDTDAYRYRLSVRDVLQCMSHWPCMEKLTVFNFSSTSPEVNLPRPACSIKTVTLDNGFLRLEQLRLLTTSWCSSLREVYLTQISGLTNEHIRTWLLDVGPTLTSLVIQYSYLRRGLDEVYALDAVLPIMVNLRHLKLHGDIASELILLRYSPCKEQSWYSGGNSRSLKFTYLPRVYMREFVDALKVTEWTEIHAQFRVIHLWDSELEEEAKKVVHNRGIRLMIEFESPPRLYQ